MSTHDESGQDVVPTMRCEVCQVDVPAGNFCGLCGSHLVSDSRKGPRWLRGDTFGAAPNENVLLPSVASSLFPHLPQRSRTPFRVGLVLLLMGLVGFAVIKMPVGVDHGRALGLPVLFLLYLAESGVYRDVPLSVLCGGRRVSVRGSAWAGFC